MKYNCLLVGDINKGTLKVVAGFMELSFTDFSYGSKLTLLIVCQMNLNE